MRRHPTILFFNKCDRAASGELVDTVRHRYAPAIAGSALTGEGIDDLKAAIIELYDRVTPLKS